MDVAEQACRKPKQESIAPWFGQACAYKWIVERGRQNADWKAYPGHKSNRVEIDFVSQLRFCGSPTPMKKGN